MRKAQIIRMLEITGSNGVAGANLIMRERHRQVYEEGYSEDRDDKLVSGELADFACCYAISPKGGDASNIIKTLKPEGWILKLSCNGNTDDNTQGRIKDLVKAGALIAAEIDRLLRIEVMK
jgi:hypothetical protein